VVTASYVDSKGRNPVWLGLTRLRDLAMGFNLIATTLLRIFAKVWRRTITRQDIGEE